MTKEKKISLKKYMDDMSGKLSGPTPEKHKDRPETYKNFLKREIAMVKSQLDAEALEVAGGK